ncbi:MAG: hypothetical protein L0Y56_18635 [Nitrospira sp.]|nr:hypothetical protein [Nitrospira sp.]
MNLNDFRDEVKHVLGGAGVGNSRIDRWINQGIQTLVGQLRFKELLNHGTLDTVVDVVKYALPTGTLGVNSAWIESEKKRLLQTTLENLPRGLTQCRPRQYATDGSFIYFSHPPDKVYTVDFIYTNQHPKLVSPLEVTVLPALWDTACTCFAKYYALQSLNRESQARNWFQKGQHEVNIQRASLEYDFEGGPNAGFGFATELEHLTDFR